MSVLGVWITGERGDSDLGAGSPLPSAENGKVHLTTQGRTPAEAGLDGKPSSAAASSPREGGSPHLSPDLEDWLADSPEEAEWLRSHGYPSLSDIEFMDGLSLDQLADLANAGNKMAQAFLGTRLALAEKDFAGGVKTLESAALEDSVYTLTALASVHEASGNPALAQGYRIAAFLRGDYETVFVHDIIESFSASPNPQWETSLGFLAGQAIIDRLNQTRVAAGLSPLPPATPRPGAESAYQTALQALQRLADEGVEHGQPKPPNSKNGG